jgi:hypothetical protein
MQRGVLLAEVEASVMHLEAGGHVGEIEHDPLGSPVVPEV